MLVSVQPEGNWFTGQSSFFRKPCFTWDEAQVQSLILTFRPFFLLVFPPCIKAKHQFEEDNYSWGLTWFLWSMLGRETPVSLFPFQVSHDQRRKGACLLWRGLMKTKNTWLLMSLFNLKNQHNLELKCIFTPKQWHTKAVRIYQTMWVLQEKFWNK